jgi:hypothetical protein
MAQHMYENTPVLLTRILGCILLSEPVLPCCSDICITY